MKIAVLVAGLRFDSQRRIINGILEKAVEDGTSFLVMLGLIHQNHLTKARRLFLVFRIFPIMMALFSMVTRFMNRV